MVNLVAIAVINKNILQAIIGFTELKDSHRLFMGSTTRALFAAFIRAPIGRIFMRHATAE